MTNKKYILIQNDGEIETNSFELIGASTKRGEAGKIGFFGSGLKYSIAYMMRNGIDFKVFSGMQELLFTTTPEALKDKSFDRICINGKPTSYTVTMGPTWTKDWFVLREIYCNALDESNCQLIRGIDAVSPSEGKTRIFIEMTDTLCAVVDNWDNYFSDERTPIAEFPKVYTSGLGGMDGSAAAMNYQPVKVYNKTNGVLYRRGVNVHETDIFIFDYELEYVDVNEDRTAKNIATIEYAFLDMLGQAANEDWVKAVFRSALDAKGKKEYYSMGWGEPDQRINVAAWEKLTHENLFVVKEISGRFEEEIQRSKTEAFLIPANFARHLKKQAPNTRILGMGSVIGDKYFSEVEKTPKMEYLLKEVIKSLEEMGYSVPHDIRVAEFDNDHQLGLADIKEKRIYLAAKTFDMGRREIALTLMEETEHIVSKYGDETRAFQTHIFSQWLKTMENQNGLFL